MAVLDPAGEPVEVTTRRATPRPRASPPPAPPATPEVDAWAGPWPVRERWWDAARARSVQRFQVVDADGTAWLLCSRGGPWFAEARYD